jgi:hypothetical protein
VIGGFWFREERGNGGWSWLVGGEASAATGGGGGGGGGRRRGGGQGGARGGGAPAEHAGQWPRLGPSHGVTLEQLCGCAGGSAGLVSDLFLSGRRWNSWNHFQCDGNGEVVIRETGASSLSLLFFFVVVAVTA